MGTGVPGGAGLSLEPTGIDGCIVATGLTKLFGEIKAVDGLSLGRSASRDDVRGARARGPAARKRDDLAAAAQRCCTNRTIPALVLRRVHGAVGGPEQLIQRDAVRGIRGDPDRRGEALRGCMLRASRRRGPRRAPLRRRSMLHPRSNRGAAPRTPRLRAAPPHRRRARRYAAAWRPAAAPRRR